MCWSYCSLSLPLQTRPAPQSTDHRWSITDLCTQVPSKLRTLPCMHTMHTTHVLLLHACLYYSYKSMMFHVNSAHKASWTHACGTVSIQPGRRYLATSMQGLCYVVVEYKCKSHVCTYVWPRDLASFCNIAPSIVAFWFSSIGNWESRQSSTVFFLPGVAGQGHARIYACE